jgi:hypothetical protein
VSIHERGEQKKRFLPATRARASATELAKTLYKIPTLLTTWTRCGKPQCRCTAGHLHGPYHALHWREGSVQRRRYVRAAEVPAVQEILAKRRAQRRRERHELHLARMTWRELARLVEEYEAELHDEWGLP